MRAPPPVQKDGPRINEEIRAREVHLIDKDGSNKGNMTPADALRYGLRDKATVRVRVQGDREIVFGDVRIRVDPNFALAMHIDTDEANAANLGKDAQGIIDGIQDEG